jgi:hypothetical protein
MRQQVRENQVGPVHQGEARANRAIWMRSQIDIDKAMLHSPFIKAP